MKKNYIYFLSLGIVAYAAYLYFFRKKEDEFVGKNIIVGDSHAVGISRLLKNVQKSSCAVGGWMVSNVIKCLTSQPEDKGVAKVFISIGTNGLYSQNDKVEDLINLLKSKYPKAKIYVYGGSYGWSGNLSKSAVEERRNKYYKRFTDNSVILLKNGLGYFKTDGEAHSITSPQAKAIAEEINSKTELK